MYTYGNYLRRIEEVSANNLFFDGMKKLLLLALFTILLMAFIDLVFKKKLERYMEFLGKIFAGITIIFCVVCFFLSANFKAEIKADFKENVPLVWKVEKTVPLYSLNTSSGQNIEASGDLFVSKVRTNNVIDYEYVTKTDNGFQLLRLSSSADVYEENAVFLKEDGKKKPSLTVERKTYEDERFKELFFERSIFFILTSEPKRYTFTVPSGTVKTEFNYN